MKTFQSYDYKCTATFFMVHSVVYYNQIFRVANSICHHLWPMCVRLRNKSRKFVIREQKTHWTKCIHCVSKSADNKYNLFLMLSWTYIPIAQVFLTHENFHTTYFFYLRHNYDNFATISPHRKYVATAFVNLTFNEK